VSDFSLTGQAMFEEVERVARSSMAAAKKLFITFAPGVRVATLRAADRYYAASPFWDGLQREHEALAVGPRTVIARRLLKRPLTYTSKSL
jgi:hypothetical protein